VVTEASSNRVQWRRNLHEWVQAELKPRFNVDHRNFSITPGGASSLFSAQR
jgi:hypothetical protein